MYVEAYELIKEILQDEHLNEHIEDATGKSLAIIDSGPQVTLPAVAIEFKGGAITRPDNQKQEVEYDVIFALPFFGTDGMKLCHDFLDVLIDTFFAHEKLNNEGRNSFAIRVDPMLLEKDPEEDWWTVGVRAAIAIF